MEEEEEGGEGEREEGKRVKTNIFARARYIGHKALPGQMHRPAVA